MTKKPFGISTDCAFRISKPGIAIELDPALKIMGETAVYISVLDDGCTEKNPSMVTQLILLSDLRELMAITEHLHSNHCQPDNK